jgi:phosphatidylglycerophosphate synthase
MNFFSFAYKIPGYVFGLHALCMWLYLVADNVDGKQARATKSASPLGIKISFFPHSNFYFRDVV